MVGQRCAVVHLLVAVGGDGQIDGVHLHAAIDGVDVAVVLGVLDGHLEAVDGVGDVTHGHGVGDGHRVARRQDVLVGARRCRAGRALGYRVTAVGHGVVLAGAVGPVVVPLAVVGLHHEGLATFNVIF